MAVVVELDMVLGKRFANAVQTAGVASLAATAADPFDALAAGSNEIEFDADELEAAAQRPFEGPADSDLDLDDGSLTVAVDTESRDGLGFELETEFDAAGAVDGLDALDEADLESLAALVDDEAMVPTEDPPDAITQRRAAAGEDLFGEPGTDLSIFDGDDDEI